MRHLKGFNKFEFIKEDVEKSFDIDNGILSYVFGDLTDKYPGISYDIVDTNSTKNYEIEIKPDPMSSSQDLSQEYKFLTTGNTSKQISNYFDSFDQKITDIKKEDGKIIYTISKI